MAVQLLATDPNQIYGDVVPGPQPFSDEQLKYIDAFRRAKATWIQALEKQHDPAKHVVGLVGGAQGVSGCTSSLTWMSRAQLLKEHPDIAERALQIAIQTTESAKNELDESFLKLQQLKDKVTIFPCPDIQPKHQVAEDPWIATCRHLHATQPDSRADFDRWYNSKPRHRSSDSD